jgi:DNA (cytosine-5)-methyltransferase 1
MRIETEVVDDDLERVWIDTTPPGYALHPSGLLVPCSMAQPRRPVGVDLFAGCGGFSLGFEAAGFNMVVAVDWEPTAAFTYAYNLGAPGGCFYFTDDEAEDRFRKAVAADRRRAGREARFHAPFPDEVGYFGLNNQHRDGTGCRGFILGDIRKIGAAEILEAGALREGEAEVVIGGPPCQGFSTMGRQDPADPRNNLVLEYLRVVIELGVPAFIMENVPPLITQEKFRPLWEVWQERAHAAGYSIAADVLDACNYGVPQHRRRAIIVGTRGAQRFHFPLPTHWGLTSPCQGEGVSMIDLGREEDGPVDLEPEDEPAQRGLFE